MKKLKIKLIIKELYNKLLTSNVPTYLLSSQDKVNLGAIKTLKAILLKNIFVFWFKFKCLLARKEEILKAKSKKEQVNVVVIIKGFTNVKLFFLSLLVEFEQSLLLGRKTDVVEGAATLLNNEKAALGVSKLTGLVQNTKVFSTVEKKVNILAILVNGVKAVTNTGLITGDRVFSMGVGMVFEKKNRW